MRRTISLFLSGLACTFTLFSALNGHALERTTAQPHLLAAARATQLEGMLNVNTATASQWQLLPGVGPSTADKIVVYRQRKPFAEVSHVMRIKGIGRKTFNKIKPYLTMKGSTTLTKTR
ncbi:MAG: helix-hairpin-helix domain-containing protein [Nannocystaceae bacterium]